jgi:hypothetical protein
MNARLDNLRAGMQQMPIEVQMALGRLFLLASRPAQPGDEDTFHAIRSIVMNEADARGMAVNAWQPNYARDRRCGAQGD